MNNISRREMMILLGGGVTAAVLSTTGCPVVSPVIVRVLPTLSRVFWGAVKLGDAFITIKTLAEEGEKFLSPDASATDIAKLQGNAPLVIEDGKGKQFNTPYVVCEAVSIVQSCYRGESLGLYVKPSENSRRINSITIGDSVGIIDLTHIGGWYHVQTLSGERGWVHGNCLQRLPRKF